MRNFFLSRLQSFAHAFRGLWYVLRTQRNAGIHVVIATFIFVLAWWLRLGSHDWALIILTSAMVFTAEFLNTAIEAVVDLASPEKHPLAKVGKDVGAGAVLIAALAAILIGALVLGPPLWTRLSGLFATH